MNILKTPINVEKEIIVNRILRILLCTATLTTCSRLLHARQSDLDDEPPSYVDLNTIVPQCVASYYDTYQCVYCEGKPDYESMEALQQHFINAHPFKISYTRTWHCSYEGCDYVTRDSGNIKPRIRSHTGEKPYTCSYEGCDYAASHKSSLVHHLRTHTGEKPYRCFYEDCDFAANVKCNLKTHQRLHHLICCDQQFDSKEALNEHITDAHNRGKRD